MMTRIFLFSTLFLASFFLQASNLSEAFESVFKGMESNFSHISQIEPIESGKYQNFYNNNAYVLPHTKDSYFVESKTSGQRYLNVVLNYDLNTLTGKESFNKLKLEMLDFNNYTTKMYSSDEGEHRYSVYKEDNYIGTFTIVSKEGKASMKLYAFNGGSFFSTLNQVIREGISNRFEPYKGEKEGLADNQRMSKLKSYKDSYAIYSLHENNVVAHQCFYQHWPKSMFFEVFGSNSETIKQALGSSYKVNSFEVDESAKSLLINLTYSGKTILIQVLEKDDTQIVGVAVQ